MDIRWLGHSCFEIKNKSISIITDPYSPEIGLKLPKLKANIITVSHDHYDHNNIEAIDSAYADKKPFVIDGDGGYEIEGVLVEGIRTFHDDKGGTERGPNTVYDIKIDGMTVCHLGDLGGDLTEEQVEELDGVDILFVPVGGKYTLDAEGAAKVVNKIEPRIVIPMHYQIDGLKMDIGNADKFIKEIGLTAENLDSLKIEKKDLPVEGMRLIILNKA
ncbi:MAG TPA: MBL fold metallo-hydrolase [Patescibacteria group bacterium]|nr:MBL fold metallo-hydrolase [Patescibacteria group bacterium]